MRTCAKCNHDCHEDAVSLRAALAAKDAEIERLRTALRVVLAARPSLTEKGWQVVQDALGEGGKKEE